MLKVNTKLLRIQVLKNSLTLFFLLFFAIPLLRAQNVRVDFHQKSLNEALVELRESHQIDFSFDDALLSNYQISLTGTFPNPEKALRALIRDLPLAYESIDGVFVIYPFAPKDRGLSLPVFVLTGTVKDAYNGESLPYSHLIINQSMILADGQGSFSFSSPDSVYRLQASYLGYYRLDTLMTPGTDRSIRLKPSVVGLKEVVVQDKTVKLSTMSNLNAGEMRLNHQVGNYLPGFADNAVYNLLRLQPGVLAAGEQANDLIIWGSYSGQTAVLFDGFTIFGLKNYNDNIGVVNPFMVKDIKLLKGGYPANYGGKAGGIVDITGTSGNRSKPELILSATNRVLNTKLSLPVTRSSAVSMAFRQTYYNLYKDYQLAMMNRPGRPQGVVDQSVNPDYMFRDFTFKYAGSTKSGDFYYLDFLRGSDQFNYALDFTTMGNRTIHNVADESHSQIGSSLFYGKSWGRGGKTNFTFSYSDLKHELLNQTSSTGHGMFGAFAKYENIENRISKFQAKADHRIQVNQRHSLEAGLEIQDFRISLSEDTVGQNLYYDLKEALALEGYVQDRISFKSGLNLIAGLRLDAPFYLNRVLVQPRVSMNYKLGPGLWLKAGWGRYDQYVIQTSVVDEAGNYRYFWTLSDEAEVPVQSANHFTAGLNYQLGNYSFGMEGYFKKLSGLTRYIYSPGRQQRALYNGTGIANGLDFLIQGKYHQHTAWISYTLSQTLEHFSYFPSDQFRRAPQDQRHEVKLALLLNFDPFYFSSNYVYGSGFPDRSPQSVQTLTTDLRYSRWDISGVYRFQFRKLDFQTGVSVLNVLNTENIKLQNFVQVPDNQGVSVNILAEAVPFTPTLFLVIKF